MSIFCLYKFFCFYGVKFLPFSTGPVSTEAILLGPTLFTRAIQQGHARLVDEFLKANTHTSSDIINQTDLNNGHYTPIGLALKARKPETALVLLSHGANASVKYPDGQTPYALAKNLNYEDVKGAISNQLRRWSSSKSAWCSTVARGSLRSTAQEKAAAAARGSSL